MKAKLRRWKPSDAPRIKPLWYTPSYAIKTSKSCYHASSGPAAGHNLWLSDFYAKTLVFSIKGQKGFYVRGEWHPC